MLAVEELSRVDPSVGVLVDVQNTLVINALLRWGSDDIESGATCRDWRRAPSAPTPCPEAGPAATRSRSTTRAREDGDDFVLNGRKLWITNANEADLFIVFATVDPDAGLPRHHRLRRRARLPGFTVGKKEDKLGIRASSTCELILEDCRVPSDERARRGRQGLQDAIETLNEGRIGIGAQMIGLARGALEHAIRYTKERKQFGKADRRVPGVQHQIARAAASSKPPR